MKKLTACLVALMLLGLAGTAFAAGTVMLDKALYTHVYGSTVTNECNTVIAGSLRDKENHTEGENPTAAWLACIGADGQILWEKKDERPGSRCIYDSPCVLNDGSVIALYVERNVQEGGAKVQYMLRSFSPKGESTGELTLNDTYRACLSTDNGVLVSLWTAASPGLTPCIARCMTRRLSLHGLLTAYP